MDSKNTTEHNGVIHTVTPFLTGMTCSVR